MIGRDIIFASSSSCSRLFVYILRMESERDRLTCRQSQRCRGNKTSLFLLEPHESLPSLRPAIRFASIEAAESRSQAAIARKCHIIMQDNERS